MAWQGNDMGMAGEWHGTCELAFNDTLKDSICRKWVNSVFVGFLKTDFNFC
jgi:hypothetical protein